MAFSAQLAVKDQVAHVTLKGELDASVAGQFKETIEEAAAEAPRRLVLHLGELDFLASAGLRVLIFAKQKMGAGVDIYVVGSRGPVLASLKMSGFHHSVYLQDSYDEQ